MSYIGAEPTTASFNSDVFSGDGSTTGFTLTAAPGSSGAVIVTIDGVKQHTSAYSVSGTTLTFTAAPPSGTNNIEVIHLGVRVEVPQVAADSITQAEIATGSLNPIVQVGFSNITSVVQCNVAIPLDDTIPQNTEGVEVTTVTITPTSATNILLIEWQLVGTTTASIHVSSAIYQDSTADALAASAHWSYGAGALTLTGQYKMAAGTTSSTTFKVHGGTTSTSSFYVNGSNAGTRIFGGVCNSYLRVTEVQQ